MHVSRVLEHADEDDARDAFEQTGQRVATEAGSVHEQHPRVLVISWWPHALSIDIARTLSIRERPLLSAVNY
jgi:hypothetical protein